MYFLCFNWHDIFQNAIGCTIGSFVAICISYLLYLGTNKNATKNKIAEEKNQLKAFALMLANALKMSKQQTSAFESFLLEVKKHDSEFPLPIIYPTAELARIVNTITIEKTGLAYMKFFSNDNSAKEFTDIIKGVDFLYAEFTELYSHIKRANQNHFERKVRFSNVFDVSSKFINNYWLNNKEDKIAISLLMAKHNFDTQRKDLSDLEIVKSLFFEPVNQLVLSLVKQDFENFYLNELFFYTSKGKEYYKDIIVGYEKFEKEIETILGDLDSQIKKLENDSSEILKAKIDAL